MSVPPRGLGVKVRLSFDRRAVVGHARLGRPFHNDEPDNQSMALHSRFVRWPRSGNFLLLFSVGAFVGRKGNRKFKR
jgi:hypothetical protein